tara:strand:- start:879 stop:1892 length:1014 start_codon:yes stop_codon:yes gene_type:complete
MNLDGLRVLVTGSAGFIGFHTASELLQRGATVLGVDNFGSYYDVALKEARNDLLSNHPRFAVARVSIDDSEAFGAVWRDFGPDVVIHLAAQAGVRYSIDHPESYVASNIIGTFNVLELARHNPLKHLLVASTSSVYGANTDMPFAETQRTQTPVSLYAATKGSTELLGHSYSHLFGIPATFFRFFTVYGPWGRPDMALFKFTKAILEDRPIDVYNNGEMERDFTYVADLVDAVVALVNCIPGAQPALEGDSLSPVAPFRVVNIGGGTPTRLMDYIAELERALGRPAIKNFMPMQPGDVLATHASSDLLQRLIGKVPETPPSEGIPAFVKWYRDFYSA